MSLFYLEVVAFVPVTLESLVFQILDNILFVVEKRPGRNLSTKSLAATFR